MAIKEPVKNNRIEFLDGLRGMAILLVILYHAYARWPDLISFVKNTQNILIFKYGNVGVNLFFMISGFVIFMTLDKNKSFSSFIKKRWLRLFPAMAMASLIIYSTHALFQNRPSGTPDLINLIPGITFINPSIIEVFTGTRIAGIEGAFWTIYIEVVFYLLIGMTYYRLGRKCVLPVIFAMSFYNVLIYKIFPHLMDFSSLRLSLDFGFDYYPWFFIGCYMYERINGRVNRYNTAMFIAVILLCLFLSRHDHELMLIHAIAMSFFCCSFYSSRIQRALSSRLMLFFGFISYPLYLIHENMMISMIISLNRYLGDHWYSVITPIIPVSGLILTAYIIVLIEPKLRKPFVKKTVV